MENESKILKALILIGGFGTRLRPLTLTRAKPFIEFANLPILCHQIEALVKVGVKEIILAIGYQKEKIAGIIQDLADTYKIKISCSVEEVPLGSAGAIYNAKDLLVPSIADYFFVFNADIICNFPLQEMMEFHKEKKGMCTIATTQVEDSKRFGVIQYETDTDKILNFREKPEQDYGKTINAGLYIMSKQILSRLVEGKSSVEREVFPTLAISGEIYRFGLTGYWKDLGTPQEFLLGSILYLKSLHNIYPKMLLKKNNVRSPVLCVVL